METHVNHNNGAKDVMEKIVIHYEVEKMTEPEEFLAYLISQYEVSINNGWWFKQKPEEPVFTVALNCNDVFMWGCSDCEPLAIEDLEVVSKLVYTHNHWGSAAWCIAKRKMRPQEPVVELMVKAGWDIEKLVTLDPSDAAKAFTAR